VRRARRPVAATICPCSSPAPSATLAHDPHGRCEGTSIAMPAGLLSFSLQDLWGGGLHRDGEARWWARRDHESGLVGDARDHDLWRWPPESWCGTGRLILLWECDWSSSSITRWRPGPISALQATNSAICFSRVLSGIEARSGRSWKRWSVGAAHVAHLRFVSGSRSRPLNRIWPRRDRPGCRAAASSPTRGDLTCGSRLARPAASARPS